MKKILWRVMGGLIVAACCLLPLSLHAQNQTVSGNLTVTGTSDFEGDTLTFGTNSSTTDLGVLTLYTDGTTSTTEFDASRSANIWKWQQNQSATLQLQMKLDNNNNLTLYNSSGTVEITLNPGGTSTFQNSVTLNGTSNTMPNQTLSGGSSVLTESLGNGLYLSSTAATLALGTGTSATGTDSVALGYGTTASGNYSTALGYNTKAQAYEDVAVGQYNVGGGTAGSYVSGDPLFEVGNGASSGSLSDALAVYKNGNATFSIGGTTTFANGAYIAPFSTGTWINMPTTGPSGIGTGGPGGNVWAAYVPSNGNFFSDANAGDVVYRNLSGNLLFGTSGGNATMAVSGANVGIGTTTPATTLEVNGGELVDGTISVGSGASIASWSGGTWIDMPTSNSSGIGTGGPGDDAWAAYVAVSGQWFGGASTGDVAYRNLDGRLLFGTSTTPTMTVSGNNVGIGTMAPATTLQVQGIITAQPGGDIPMFSGD